MIGLTLLFALLSLSTGCHGQSVKRNAGEYSFSVHTKSIDEIPLGYLDEGRGDTLLFFVHGLGSNKMAWSKNIVELRDKYRCIAVDLPGYQDSGYGAGIHDFLFYTDILSSFIKSFGGVKVLIGHSMGGQLTIMTASAFPELIDRIVLVAPAGFELFSEEAAQMMKNIYQAQMVCNMTEEQIEASIKLNFYQFPEDATFMIHDRIVLTQEQRFTHYCDVIVQNISGMLNNPVAALLPDIIIPVLILFGEKDQLIPNKFFNPQLTVVEVGESGHEELPDSQLKFIENGGHMLQWERSKEVNLAILSYLKK